MITEITPINAGLACSALYLLIEIIFLLRKQKRLKDSVSLHYKTHEKNFKRISSYAVISAERELYITQLEQTVLTKDQQIKNLKEWTEKYRS